MPSRNRSREAAKARKEAELAAEGIEPEKQQKRQKKKKRPAGKGKDRNGPGVGQGAKTGPSAGRRARTGPMFDPSAGDDSEVRFVMAGDATKPYVCPGCNRNIAPGVGHIVAVPPDAPDLRRHWHRGCWDNRHSRF